MQEFPTLPSLQISGKRVLLRAGFDVPIEEGKVIDTERIEALVPTMRYILEHGASLILLAHQGRPKDSPDPAFSQKPLLPALEKFLKRKVQFAPSCIGEQARALASGLKPGEVLLLENARFHPGEKKNDPEFSKQLASLADVYVNDAFTNCHRAHASMVGVPALLPSAMGLQLEQEVTNLSNVLHTTQRPVVLLVSGAKMETKVPVIEYFLNSGEHVLLGGAIANTFIAASGCDIGKSKMQNESLQKAKELLIQAKDEDKASIHLPTDVCVAAEPLQTAHAENVAIANIRSDMCIFDIGTGTVDAYCEIIARAGTVIWNGPLGLYEVEKFSHASIALAKAVAAATARGATTVLGGGDTIDLHHRYHLPLHAYTFVSMGGGAMLEFVAGKELPALKALTIAKKASAA